MVGFLEGEKVYVQKHIGTTIGIRIHSRWIEEPLRQNVENAGEDTAIARNALKAGRHARAGFPSNFPVARALFAGSFPTPTSG